MAHAAPGKSGTATRAACHGAWSRSCSLPVGRGLILTLSAIVVVVAAATVGLYGFCGRSRLQVVQCTNGVSRHARIHRMVEGACSGRGRAQGRQVCLGQCWLRARNVHSSHRLAHLNVSRPAQRHAVRLGLADGGGDASHVSKHAAAVDDVVVGAAVALRQICPTRGAPRAATRARKQRGALGKQVCIPGAHRRGQHEALVRAAAWPQAVPHVLRQHFVRCLGSPHAVARGHQLRRGAIIEGHHPCAAQGEGVKRQLQVPLRPHRVEEAVQEVGPRPTVPAR
mmetsp:Transcript_58232/g.161125  ORF Transcript_58232/g.161125 Transcript_58232/m.161125 type:complete len:282 (-) Transcript_58232:65-910(-)